MIFPGPFSKVREVNVGRQKINLWSAGSPNVEDVRQWPCAWILTGLVSWAEQSGVDKHGQRVFGLTEFGNSIDVTRNVPVHENFISSRSLAKGLLPGAAGLKTICGPNGP